MKRKFAAILAAVMCMTVFTACGSTKDVSSDNTSAETKTEGNTLQENTGDVAGAESENKGEEKTTLIVGTNAEFPPFEYLGDDGEPDGFDIALIKAIGEKMGMEVQIQNMEFNSLVAAIGTKIDAAIAGMTVTQERQTAVDFSDNYYEAEQAVIIRSVDAIATAADLENKIIGVQMGTTGNFIADEISGAVVQAYNKGVDAVNDLINGRVDAVIIDKNPAQVFAEKFPEDIVVMDGEEFDFEQEYYAIALPKGSELVEKVNQALAELQEDGTFDALVSEYIDAAE